MTQKEYRSRKRGDLIRYVGGEWDMVIRVINTGAERIISLGPKHQRPNKIGDFVSMCSYPRMTFIAETETPNIFRAKNKKEMEFIISKT